MGRWAQYRKRGRGQAQADSCPVIPDGSPIDLAVNADGFNNYNVEAQAGVPAGYFVVLFQSVDGVSGWVPVTFDLAANLPQTMFAEDDTGTFGRVVFAQNVDGSGCAGVPGPVAHAT